MPTLNREKLEEEFDIENEEDVTDVVVYEPEVTVLGPIPNNDSEIVPIQPNESSKIAREAVEKTIKTAEKILDKCWKEMDTGGNFSTGMVEVATGVINSIAAASKELIGDENYRIYLRQKQRLSDLKEREVVVKENKSTGKPANQNLIIATREDVLKIMHDKDSEK